MAEEKTIICEKCGAEMCKVDEGCTVGMKCPGCGWGWVTTHPAVSDRETYSIFLEVCEQSAAQIKLIASVANCNYSAAKKLIASAPVAVFSGSAIAVKDARNKLEAAGIAYSITPAFPW